MDYEETLKNKIAFYLEDIETPLGLTIDLVILGLIFLSLVMFVLETYGISDNLRLWFSYIDISILILFTLEYCLRLWCAQSKIKFIFNIFSLLDLLAIIPLFLGIIDIHFLRIFRWFRFLKIISFIELELSIFKINTVDGIIFSRIFLTLFSIIFVYSGLIYQVESPHNQESFGNFFDALYFCVVTMTTVGFGDVTPLSEVGKLVTLMMIITGVFLIPWQIGELIRQFLKTIQKQTKRCLNCGLMFHDFDAKYCKNCGYSLEESAILKPINKQT